MLRLFCLIGLVTLFVGCKHWSTPPRVLIFTKTAGYRHASIPAGRHAIREACRQAGILADTTENADDFNELNLKRYATVIFLCTTGDVLNPQQEVAFERYIQAGGGYVGIHAATDTEYGWTWYGGLAGGYFNGHPPGTPEATLHVKDHQHESTKHLKGDTWVRKDEWYNFKDLNPNTHILLTLDEKTYQGGTNGDNHPAAWYHEYDGGRAFYTAGGHTAESYAEPDFLQHVMGGIRYAIGNNAPLNFNKCHTEKVPDPTRFTKTTVASNLFEPMEIDMLPDGRILLIERRGAMKVYDPATRDMHLVYQFNVVSALEDGLMGLAIDPNYEKNHWIYVYYSPVGEVCNQISRFVYQNDQLDLASEEVILRVYTQRDECCHAGGCLEFDDHGNLFLSAGDNTNPFASDGYAPIDEQPGRSAWDAQKSSGNTNDLRGKILRIKVLDDGSFMCPQGNLFAANGAGPFKEINYTTQLSPNAPAPKSIQLRAEVYPLNKGYKYPQGHSRPEIYVMGCRNPFRISWDERRQYLFWGEVGPDAGEPDSSRGPRGHDEVNRARAAGFFGWPYFVGNNKQYFEYDFRAKQSLQQFNPEHPVNNSPNNTGITDLPPAQPAFIWYPYSNSPEFPLVRNGGRNAMAGPVYYCDKYPEQTRLPKYFDGKLIIYDWARHWMMAVTLDSLGNFSRMEPFADSLKFSRPMDMLVDKNGSLWVLEYGEKWFAQNEDATLSRIDFHRGNRPPLARLAADTTAGATPFAVRFSVANTRDYDNDPLRYTLDFGDKTPPLRINAPKKYEKNGPIKHQIVKGIRLDSIVHHYLNPGDYKAILTVEDEKGGISQHAVNISAGNEPPLVSWNLSGHNRSFYKPGTTLQYAVQVYDAEDGSLAGGRITPGAVATTIDYLQEGFDITLIAQGHQTALQMADLSKGKSLLDQSDCKTCHALALKVNGPSYEQIADRYKGDATALDRLAQKVIKGGNGVWGETVMSAHPQLNLDQAKSIVEWILGLSGPAKTVQTLPVNGTYPLLTPPSKEKGKTAYPGTYILRAAYRDRGAGGQGAQEGAELLALRPAFQQAEQADSMSAGINQYRPYNGDTVVLRDLKNDMFLMFRRCDMGGFTAVSLGIGGGDRNNQYAGGRIEVRLDRPDGQLIGKGNIPLPAKGRNMQFSEMNIPVSAPNDGRFHNLYIVMKNDVSFSDPVAAIDWVRIELK